MIRNTLAALLFLILGSTQIAFANNQTSNQATTESLPTSNQNIPQHNDHDILKYIDQKLSDAGFSKESKEYLLSVSYKQISSAKPDQLLDKALIDKNIYDLIENLNIQNPQASMLISTQLNQAKIYNQPWTYMLANKQLELFNSHSAFSTLSKSDAEMAISGLCPIWPVCKEDRPKKKRKKHRL